MRRTSGFIFLCIALVAMHTPALAGDIFVICSSGVSVSAGDVPQIYSGEKQFAGGIKLIPVDNASLQADFLQRALKMDSTKYVALWTKKSFRDGLSAPPVKNSDTEVLDYIKRTPGACGYIGTTPAGGQAVVVKY